MREEEPQEMKRRPKWVWVLSICAVAALLVLWLAYELSKCRYRETDLTYSPDHKFYYQVQFTLCQDRAKSHARLVLGRAGKSDKAVLLDFGPSLDELHLSWHDGPELRVDVPKYAITKRYGPYDDLPRVVVTNP
jgi:hypothetical protein